MLRDIKQQSSSLGAKIIMGLLIIAFGFWGVSGSILSSNNDSAATVNSNDVSITDFNRANQTRANQMKQQFGDNIGSEYFESTNFKRGILNQLVDAELLKQEAESFNYDVSPKKIKDYIESSPGLQVDGKFSKDAYANYLAQVNKSAELLQREIKEDIKGSALPLMISTSSFVLNSEIENQFKLSKQKRSFDYLDFSSTDYLETVEVTEEEIKSHHNEFGSDYKTLEQVSVNYIELSTADLIKDIEIEDSELQSYYDAKKVTLLTSEKRLAQHILLPVDGNEDEVKQEISSIATRIADGQAFAEVAKAESQDPGSAKGGGDLGWISPGDMVEAFDAQLFSMKVGEISEPVLSKFGYHLIKLNEIKSPEIPKIEDIKETLVEELKQEKAADLFLTQADELDTIIIDSDNVLEIAAENSGLEIKTTELFALGRGVGVAANQNFSSIAFSDSIKTDNENSSMIDLGENHIAYIHINEHLAAVTKPLEEVSEVIKTKLKSEKALEIAKQKTEEYKQQLIAGETSLTDIATNMEKTVVQAIDVERVGSKQPFTLVKNVFALTQQQNASVLQIEVIESASNSFAIVKLNSITNADVSTITDADKESISSEIERNVSNTEIQNITNELRSNASIKINEKIFETN